MLGVPHDIIYPAVPHVLKRFRGGVSAGAGAASVVLNTRRLKTLYEEGKCDLIMTTEDHVGPGRGDIDRAAHGLDRRARRHGLA